MDKEHGTHIRRFINGWCPGCEESSSLTPGRLNSDGTIEFRTCVDCGETVEDHDPRFWSSAADADEEGLV
ncbi:hypothetical protein ACSBQT_03075 [Brevibacterium sp. H602]|jgi:Zn ribbon nucleic-acid-binding protein|uniref:Uncharacterized protein n=2 Tax=Brevibacterium TaxID=1696 RepID=A0A5C4X0R5_9MICO|nr:MULTISPECIES: hypothetical protein [Brevibacterium]TNM53491.1 hypothetical protein FHQ09_13925 [Brevibacterium sediminis]UZD62552.1 hypothetical protein LJ362_01400 [Brevibacterium sp. JSBI002]